VNETKQKYAFWLTPKYKDLIAQTLDISGCDSQSAFVEKAICYYADHLAAEHAETLPESISKSIEGHINMFAGNIGKMLFKMSVELEILMHIIASDTDIGQTALDKLRVHCIREVKETHGEIDFDSALRFQKGF